MEITMHLGVEFNFGTRANDTPLSTMIKIPSCTKQNIKHLPFIFYSHFTFLIIFPPVWHNMDSSFPSYNLLNFESIRFNILPSHSFITRIFKAISIYLHKFFLKRSIMLLTFLFRVNVRTLLIHSFIFASW